MKRTTWIGLFALGLFAASLQHANAGLNDPISFSTPGVITLSLETSVGGYDHILELANSLGPVGTPLMALTEAGTPSADVLGFTPANIGDTVPVGTFAAGQEIIFRLTNVESLRLGTPGNINSQIFSGSASNLNPSPTSYYTYVESLSPTSSRVYFEDAFPASPTDPDPLNSFLTGGYDVVFTLNVTPVPEPSAVLLALTGATAFSWRRRW